MIPEAVVAVGIGILNPVRRRGNTRQSAVVADIIDIAARIDFPSEAESCSGRFRGAQETEFSKNTLDIRTVLHGQQRQNQPAREGQGNAGSRQNDAQPHCRNNTIVCLGGSFEPFQRRSLFGFPHRGCKNRLPRVFKRDSVVIPCDQLIGIAKYLDKGEIGIDILCRTDMFAIDQERCKLVLRKINDFAANLIFSVFRDLEVKLGSIVVLHYLIAVLSGAARVKVGRNDIRENVKVKLCIYIHHLYDAAQLLIRADQILNAVMQLPIQYVFDGRAGAVYISGSAIIDRAGELDRCFRLRGSSCAGHPVRLSPDRHRCCLWQ